MDNYSSIYIITGKSPIQLIHFSAALPLKNEPRFLPFLTYFVTKTAPEFDKISLSIIYE